MAEPNEDLEHVIFGSDSDLSEEEFEATPSAARSRQSPQRAEEPEESGESGDEYRTEKHGKAKEKRTRRRKGEDGGAEGRRVQRKRKRQTQPEEVDLSQLPPEEASKMRIAMKIDAILKPKKASRPRKRKNEDDVLDRAADEEVSRLRESMLMAAAEDEQANREKMPATSKLRLLPSVLETLRKSSLSQSIVDNNLLEGVRKWLEPLPDRSLPALDIQREFFPLLKKMDFIDKDALKESKLGRVIVFYTKCKKASPDIQRMANELISQWSRPIIKRSASYRDREVKTIDIRGEGAGERLNTILARARESDKNRVRRNAVAIPSRELGSYTVAPAMSAAFAKDSKSVDIDIDRRRRNAERMRQLTRKVTTK
ncbi:hypothetical protein PsYK624_047660 [Phanerochaete sordida]|uniref:TFIIS N-terminal domain-containing protein n=1 Tax=Phanerochaete sordida TaxID=48140 RepID=A0A9P3G3X7_9APHY|nr:hypothetical protein PsYK624_047660 [Phanerochaete sordida]